LLVSKRCTSSNLNVSLVTNSASNNLVVFQLPILPHHSQISGYSQALISHSSLYYLY
jgi:hypothetical protein